MGAQPAARVVGLVLAGGLLVAAFAALRRAARPPGAAAVSVEPGEMADPELVTLGRGRPATPAPSLGARALRAALRYPTLAGLASVLLPCGALYGMLLLAAGSGRPATGALVGLGFAAVSGLGLAGSVAAARTLRDSRLGNSLLALVLLAGAGLVVLRAFEAPASPAGAPACHVAEAPR